MKCRCCVVVLLSLVFLLLMNGSVLGGGGFALPGVGSRALSMGGAFIGLADDWSACFWNPAGLAYLPNSEVNFNLYTLNFRPEYTPKVEFSSNGYVYTVGFEETTHYPEDRAFFLPSFSGFYKFTQIEGFSGGVAFFVPYKLEYRWDLYDTPLGYDNSVPYPRFDHQGDIIIWDLHPTLAKDFMDGKISVGGGVSIQRADFGLRRMVLTPTVVLPRPYEFFPVDWVLETDGWGVGFNVGLLYKASPKLQFGFTYRSPVDIDLEGTLDIEMFFPTLEPYFEGGTYKYSNENFKTTLPLPGNIGVGVAFKPLEKLILTFDVSSTSWSRLDYLEIEDLFLDAYSVGDTLRFDLLADDSKLPFAWDDIMRFSLGGEYIFGENLRIRGGYFFEESPIPNSTFNLLIPDMGDKNSFNLGLSYQLDSFEFGYNYELVAYQKREVSSLTDQNQDGLFDNLPGNYKMTLHTSSFSLSYRF